MTDTLVLGAVYISPIVWACIAALAGTAIASAILTRVGFYKLVWRRSLVEAAIFCMLLAASSWAPFIGVGR